MYLYKKRTSTAIFAAGCFWGVQFYFDQVPGVFSTEAGYIGGYLKKPSWEDVCRHTTGHAEAVKIKYDEKVISYEMLVRHFFRLHDPTQLNRQGPDIGDNYRSAIFYISDKQRKIAENVQEEIQDKLTKEIMTSYEQATIFWPAEDYHQKFAERTGRGSCHIPYKPI